MDISELLKKINAEYDEEAARIRRSLLKTSDIAATRRLLIAEEISAKTGISVGTILIKGMTKQFPDGVISEEDARRLIVMALEHNYQFVSGVTEEAQKAILRAAGLGINPVVPEFDMDRAVGIAKNVSDADDFRTISGSIIKNIQNHSQNIVDKSIEQNARVHQNLGLRPRVTRRYDGVGVHDGKDPCEWCISRCGEDMPYSEAKAKGAFERHPGCGCELIYVVGKRIELQTYWQHNEWSPVDESEAKLRK